MIEKHTTNKQTITWLTIFTCPKNWDYFNSY